MFSQIDLSPIREARITGFELALFKPFPGVFLYVTHRYRKVRVTLWRFFVEEVESGSDSHTNSDFASMKSVWVQMTLCAEILAPDVDSEEFGLSEIQNLISHAIGSGERYTKTKTQFSRESLKEIHRELSKRVE